MGDALDFGEQPRCVHCSTVMRDMELGGWKCPACGWELNPRVKINRPPTFDGPTLYGG